MNRHYLHILFLIVFLIVGCKTKKAIVDRGPIPERSNEEILNALSEHNYMFEWFVGQANLKISSPYENISAKTYIRIKRDSIIWSVVKKLGVEGGRILVSPTSYATINRLDGTYSRGPTDKVFSNMGLDFDFYDVQEMIYGNIMLPDDTNKINKDGDHYLVNCQTDAITTKYWVNAYDLTIDRIFLADHTGREISVNYDKYEDIEGKTAFPYERKYSIVDPDNGTTTIDLKYKKVILDTPKNTKFSIPAHYDKVE